MTTSTQFQDERSFFPSAAKPPPVVKKSLTTDATIRNSPTVPPAPHHKNPTTETRTLRKISKKPTHLPIPSVKTEFPRSSTLKFFEVQLFYIKAISKNPLIFKKTEITSKEPKKFQMAAKFVEVVERCGSAVVESFLLVLVCFIVVVWL